MEHTVTDPIRLNALYTVLIRKKNIYTFSVYQDYMRHLTLNLFLLCFKIQNMLRKLGL